MKETKKTFYKYFNMFGGNRLCENLNDISSKHFVLEIERHDPLIIGIIKMRRSDWLKFCAG